MIDKITLSQEELDLTEKLSDIIKSKIKNTGNINFAEFMNLALYYPALGYYVNPKFKFSSIGDFITAPKVSTVFGFCIAKQIYQVFTDSNIKHQILELGAGDASLAIDITNSLYDFIDAYMILELSAELKVQQYNNIKDKAPILLSKIKWINSIPDVFDGVILGNEVLDANPCEIFTTNESGNVSGVGVGLRDNDEFIYVNCDLSLTAKDMYNNLDLNLSNYRSELHTYSYGLVNSLANSLGSGVVLFIDYGYLQNEYYYSQRSNGTLRGFFRQHKVDNVLSLVGLMDITTSVNFSLIRECAIKNGLSEIGYISQANFLINCGILDVLLELKQTLTEQEYRLIVQQVDYLTSPLQMGDVFKVIAFRKNLELDNYVGFNSLILDNR